MKKKLIAALTSLLLVICACVSLVACGGNGDNPDKGNAEDNSLVGNWIYEGEFKDKDLYLVVSADDTGTGKYSALRYSILGTDGYSTTNGLAVSGSISFQRNEDGTYTGNVSSSDKDQLTVGSITYKRTTQTLDAWKTAHNAYQKLVASSWLSDAKLQGYAIAEELTEDDLIHLWWKGSYKMTLTYVDNMWGDEVTESHLLESAGLTKNTYKWGKYILTLEDDNTFTLSYTDSVLGDEFYTFTRTTQTLAEWKKAHNLS